MVKTVICDNWSFAVVKEISIKNIKINANCRNGDFQ